MLLSTIRAAATEFYVGSTMAGLRRRYSVLRHPGSRTKLTLYHRADEPRSVLFANLLSRWLGHESLVIDLEVVAPLPESLDPSPELRRKHEREDGHRLAQWLGVSPPAPPSSVGQIHQRLLLASRSERLTLAMRLAADDEFLESSGRPLQELAASEQKMLTELARASRRQVAAGHYAPGMVEYRGEWFSVDRVGLLWERLSADGVVGLQAPDAVASDLWQPLESVEPPSDGRLTVYLSFRSPYSYIAAHRLASLGWGPRINARFVLPMVMRGLKVPWVKARYLALDAAREARRHRVPFGRLRDPLGDGIYGCMALGELAQSHECAFEFYLAVTRRIWSEALDVRDQKGLLAIAESLSMDRESCRAALAGAAVVEAAWRGSAATNRQQMQKLGYWGVPVMQWGSFAAWGQDRIELLQRHVSRATR